MTKKRVLLILLSAVSSFVAVFWMPFKIIPCVVQVVNPVEPTRYWDTCDGLLFQLPANQLELGIGAVPEVLLIVSLIPWALLGTLIYMVLSKLVAK